MNGGVTAEFFAARAAFFAVKKVVYFSCKLLCNGVFLFTRDFRTADS
jgi:hypothetical protein